MVLMDVDGILTDGRLHYTDSSDGSKQFHAQDTVGIRLAQRAGMRFGFISGRASAALARRARELEIAEVHQGALRKADVYEHIRSGEGLDPEECAYIGDDLVDLPVMRRVGFAATVPGARPELIRAAHFVTAREGGHGAVREVLDFILRVQGSWQRVPREFR
jgi:3-deoxy-D-manno-octulosonate 8-phosphate phosphatase (KDO 8-P phosphatase)